MDSTAHSPRAALKWLLFLSALDGALALAWLLRIPAGGGLSATRLALLGLLLAGTAFPLAALLRPALRARLLERWASWQADTPRNRRRVLRLLLAALGSAYLLILPADLTDAAARAVLERLAPLLFYGGAVSLHSALLLPSRKALRRAAPLGRVALAAFGVLLAAWGVVARTRWGLTPISEYWYEMGVPILETHLLLAWGVTGAARQAVRRLRRLSPRQVDAAAALGLYLLTVLLWQSAPRRPTWFFTPPAAPNYRLYPASDALRYDATAQHVFIGEGLKTENQARTLRPLYTGLLALLHAIAGSGYEAAARAQVFVLALYAALLYALGRALHSRTAGVLLALLLALQGYTNIAHANLFTISHARLLMPDLPMSVLMAAFLLLAARWQGAEHPLRRMALYSGAALGALLLVRPESAVAGAAALLTAFLQWRGRGRVWARQAACFALGAALMTAPWVGRNWIRYGQIFFDSPQPRVYDVIRRALETPQPEPPLPEALPPATPQGRESPAGKSALPLPPHRAWLSDSIQHYLNSEIQSFLALPSAFRLPDTALSFAFLYQRDVRLYLKTRPQDAAAAQRALERRLYRENTLFWAQCCQVQGYLKRLPFWPHFGGLPRQARLALGLNLLLTALGFGAAVRRWRWAGALPALVHAAYLAVNALFQVSGGRYIQPVNWIVVLYYTLGLAALTLGLGRALGRLPETDAPAEERAPAGRRALLGRDAWLLPAAAVLLLGLALPLGERLFPRRYPPEIRRRMESAALAALPPAERAQTEGLLVLSGRALYPRFLEAGGGNPLSAHPLQTAQPYGRLVFFLAGPQSFGVRLPLEGLRAPFPDDADVVVAGCVRQEGAREFLDARLAARVDRDGRVRDVFWRSAAQPLACP